MKTGGAAFPSPGVILHDGGGRTVQPRRAHGGGVLRRGSNRSDRATHTRDQQRLQGFGVNR